MMCKSKQFPWKRLSVAVALTVLAGAQRGIAQVSASSQTVITNALGSAAGVAIDPLGNLYIADGASGVLNVSQGSNAAPTSVLSGLTAPGQVAVDANRNVYVANGTSSQVLEIPYQSGSLNLNATVLLGKGLGTVTGVAVDLSGNVYIVDAGNKQVVKIVGTAQTTLATGLTAPKQIAVDRSGNVYIADAGANKVVYLPVAGGASSSVGTGLNAPAGVATDAQNDVYIADTGNGRVVEVAAVAGVPSTVQTVLTSTITAPAALALDSRGGLYIASAGSVYRYTASAIYLGLVPVGTTSQTFPVTLNFTTAVAPTTIKVVTTGITGLDYNDAGGDTCTAGSSYAIGGSCTVNVTFTPAGVGPRYGAIVLYGTGNKVLARVFLGGGGLGPQITIGPGTLTSVSPTVSVAPATFNTPRGLTTDAAGDIFIAEYGNSRILEIPASQAGSAAPAATVIATASNNSVSINGAGDLLVASGSTSVIAIPFENGTWNLTDEIVLGTGYTKARTVKTDVGGNVFWCDNQYNIVYETQIGGTPVKLPFTSYGASCLGIAIDLYGSIVTTDPTNGKVLYAPATGATPYETGTGLANGWGVTFDASGSVWVSSSGVKELVRIPNENGILTGGDQVLSSVGATLDFDIWMDDASGTLYTTQDTGNTVTAFSIINRQQSTLSFNGGKSEAIGVTSAALPEVLSSSGTLPPVYTNGGLLDLYDVNDFPATTYSPAPSSPCNFTISLAVGFTCYVAYDFSPQSSGTRAATVEITSNAPVATLNLTGISSSAVTGTITLKLAQIIPSNGSPEPGQSLTVLATATPSSTIAATGPLTFYVDGVASGSVALASNTAAFSLPAGLTLGAHTLGVTYAGDKNFPPIATPVTLSLTVVAAPSSVTLVVPSADVAVNQTFTLTASVPTASGLKTPTGKVTFATGSTTLGSGTLNASGVTSISYAFATAGAYPVIATYAGDNVYAGSPSAAVTVTAGTYTATSTALAVTPVQPAGGYVFGTALNASVTVAPQSGSGTPGGAVDLYLDGSPVSTGTALGANGAVTITLSSIGAGSHSLVAFYSGSATYATSASAAFAFRVVQASTATTLAVSSTANYASVPVTLTATVSNVNVPAAVPSGTVTFFVGKASLGSAPVTAANGVGTATLTTPLLPAGTDAITAVYQGDTNDTTSTSTAITDVVTLVPSTLAVAAAPSVVLSNGTTVLTATVTGSPITGNYAGSVTFYSGATALGAAAAVSAGGQASFTTAALTAPVNTFSATYSGSSVYTTSATTAPATVYVTDANGTGVVATASLGSGLSSTVGTAVDISGNLYIADATKGLVALVAGGAGAQSTVLASLAAPAGLAVDGAGDLFIANGAPGQVTKILAQNNALVASSAKQLGTGLGTLTGVAVDPAGNVYAADATNKQLVKIAAAGGQTVLSSTLINPQQVAVDSIGDIYVADGTGNRVVYITAAGVASTVGTGLLNPTGVAVDTYNNVYIADTGNNRVVKVPFVTNAPTGAQVTLIPTIAAPGQLAADRHQALYIGQGKSIAKWQADAASFGVITPGLTSPVYTLTYTFASAITPAAINVLTNGLAGGAYKAASGGTCAAGTAYAVGQSCTVNVSFAPVNAGITSGAVTFSSALGQPLITAYLGGVLYAPAVNFDTYTASGTKLNPGSTAVGNVTNGIIRGIAADTLGNVYLCDNTNARIVQTNTTGSTGSVLLTNTSCASVALDGAGNLIVDDMGNNRMLLLPNENGTIVGTDAYAVATGFNGPRGMTLDGFGNIVVADTSNARAVLAPIGGAATAQIFLTNSLVKTPYDAAIDWQGNLAVIDTTLSQLVYLPASGAAAAIVGPTFCAPYALAMDGGGAVFVAETAVPTTSAPCTGVVTPGEDIVRVVPGSNFYDIAQGHTNPAQGISLDTQGNLYLAYSAQFEYINRSNATPVMAFTSTAVGSSTIASTDLGGTSTATTAVIANGGPAPLTFSSATGTFLLDSGDFALTTPGTPTWLINPTPCNFTNPLAGGAACTIGLQFAPVQAGTRTAAYSPAGNEVNQPLLQLSGLATGATTTATTLTLTQKTPAGIPFPYTALTLATTLAGGGGTFGGSVAIAIDGTYLGQQAAAATLTFPDAAGLSPGFHIAVATYSGDAANAASTATLVLSAAGATPAVSVLAISPSAITVLTPSNAASYFPAALPYTSYTPVTLQATVTGAAGAATPTGLVEFLDGTTLLGTAKLTAAGVATYIASAGFTQGSHNLTANYAGDSTYSTAISTVQVLSAVYPGDFTLSVNPTSVTIVDGSIATIAITATPVANSPTGNYNGQVGLTCTGLPLYATCTFAPNSIFLDGTGAPASGTLKIVTQAAFAHNTAFSTTSAIRLCLLPGASLLLLLGMGRLRRRGLLRSTAIRNLVCILALGGILSPAVACGSHAALAPAAGTYTLTITGSGTGGINHSITMQVTLQQ